MFEVTQLHHASLIVSNISQSRAFYCGLLGMMEDPSRPDLGYPGVWIDLGSGQQLHLLELDNPDPTIGRPEHGGRDRHIAFKIKSLNLFIKQLDEHKIPYTVSKSGRAALFCRDPDGNALEFIEQKP